MRWLPLALVAVLALPVAAQEFPVASGLGFTPAPLVAAGTDEVLIVWRDADAGRVVGRRFGLDGVPRDPAPLTIVQGKTTSLSVAFDGVRYVVAWAEVRELEARVAAVFLSAEVSEPVVLMERALERVVQPSVAVAWNGLELVAVWTDATREGDAFVRAASIGTDGRIGRIVEIAGPFRYAGPVAVAAGPGHDLIVYGASSPEYLATLDAQWIDRGLAAGRRVRIAEAQGHNWGCAGSVSMGGPKALWTGSEWAVAWTSASCRFGESMNAARLSNDGAVLGRQVLTPYRHTNTRLALVMAAGEPVVLTQDMPDVIGAPVEMHRLWRNESPRRLTGNIGTFSAAGAGNRIVLVHENPYAAASAGWRVDARVLDAAFPPAPRRRAVR